MRITVEHTDNYIFTAAKDVIGQHISGVILFHETLYQKANNGTLFLELLKQRNIIPGIKVDKGVVLLFATNDESKSEGTDDGFNGEPAFCGKSIVHVANQMMSNKFNKPQSSVTLVEEEINLNKGSKSLPATLLGSPITTPDSSPPSTCVQYRRIASERIVPIIEPEILPDGIQVHRGLFFGLSTAQEGNRNDQVTAGQEQFIKRTKANGESALGQYAGSFTDAAGDAALFVANHAY
ncbi:fructose-bisphosphate aldolase-like [Polistes fuscatus]|uniref:fructose-bisphosphate aldolase-like n=1 Tax=Polistes fuscatus TaxID=30207 RepID=UPI001CA9E51A|nr:fructose-bisphosphate aldolase-like [Polistes fuscatus]